MLMFVLLTMLLLGSSACTTTGVVPGQTVAYWDRQRFLLQAAVEIHHNALLLEYAGRYDEAYQQHLRAVAIVQNLLRGPAGPPPDMRYLGSIYFIAGFSHLNAARLSLQYFDDWINAQDQLNLAIDALVETLPLIDPYSSLGTTVRRGLGGARLLQGDIAQARIEFEQAVRFHGDPAAREFLTYMDNAERAGPLHMRRFAEYGSEFLGLLLPKIGPAFNIGRMLLEDFGLLK